MTPFAAASVLLRVSVLIPVLITGLIAAESNNIVLQLRIPSEIAPAGGVAQVKLFLLNPQPIASGNIKFSLGDYSTATVFSASGDASGIVAFNVFPEPHSLNVNFSSPSGSVGRLASLPIAQLAIRVGEFGAAVVGLDLTQTSLRDPQGKTYVLKPEAVQVGRLAVGGTLSIGGVTPGGGTLPTGTVLRIEGTGFGPSTAVQIDGVSVGSVEVVSASLINVTLSAPTEMTGKHVRVSNPDRASVEYWSWLADFQSCPGSEGERCKRVVGGNGSYAPIFPLNSARSATCDLAESSAPGSSVYFAVQNPGPVPVEVTVSLSLTGRNPPPFAPPPVTHTIPAWGRKLIPPIAGGGEAHLDSDTPMQFLAINISTAGFSGGLKPLRYSEEAQPTIGSIVNAASQIQGQIAPSEIITIYGTSLGPKETQVYVNDVPAPLLYASASQLNVVVPEEAADGSTALIEIESDGMRSAARGVPVASAAPGIFTSNETGLGQAVALNQDGTVNGPSNPALRRSRVQIYVTGVALSPLVRAKIGGIDAVVESTAADSSTGLFRVDVVVPAGAQSGPVVELSLVVGSAQTQDGVTIALQ